MAERDESMDVNDVSSGNSSRAESTSTNQAGTSTGSSLIEGSVQNNPMPGPSNPVVDRQETNSDPEQQGQYQRMVFDISNVLLRANISTLSQPQQQATDQYERIIFDITNVLRQGNIPTQSPSMVSQPQNPESGMPQSTANSNEQNINPGTSRPRMAPETRQQLLQRNIQSLVHACGCQEQQCTHQSCLKMKRVVAHLKICKRRSSVGGCLTCKPLIALCCYHAKQCNEVICSVPFCPNIKHKLKQRQGVQRSQQAEYLHRHVARARIVPIAVRRYQRSKAPINSSHRWSTNAELLADFINSDIQLQQQEQEQPQQSAQKIQQAMNIANLGPNSSAMQANDSSDFTIKSDQSNRPPNAQGGKGVMNQSSSIFNGQINQQSLQWVIRNELMNILSKRQQNDQNFYASGGNVRGNLPPMMNPQQQHSQQQQQQQQQQPPLTTTTASINNENGIQADVNEREILRQIVLALNNPNLNDSDLKKHILSLLNLNPQLKAEIFEDQE